MEEDFFRKYFNELYNLVSKADFKEMSTALKILSSVKDNGRVILIGNGGSAAIASHLSIDFTKSANIRAINFNESSLLTCFSNDYGYENWASKALEFHSSENDVVILISSSGESENIINAAKFCQIKKIPLITLSGFSESNRLKKMGYANFWVSSKSYNLVENVHQIWLLSLVDYFSLT